MGKDRLVLKLWTYSHFVLYIFNQGTLVILNVPSPTRYDVALLRVTFSHTPEMEPGSVPGSMLLNSVVHN